MKKQPQAAIGISIIMIVIFLGVFANYKISVGQAVYIGNVPWTEGVIDLVSEKMVMFTVLPDEEGKSITLKTEVYPNDEDPLEYDLHVFKVDERNYGYRIDGVVEQDLIIERETAPIYLNLDTVPDLEVELIRNSIIIRNLHYLPPDSSEIKLLDADGNEYPVLIRLQAGQEFTATLETLSSFPPEVEVSIGQLSEVQKLTAEGKTVAKYSFRATHPEAVPLEITADVRGQESVAYYSFAVDNVVYELAEDNFPALTMGSEEDSATVEIILAPTRELQSLSLPCAIDENISTLFADHGARIYSYAEEPLIWNSEGASDFNTFEIFKGYFVELLVEEEVVLSASCILHELEPLLGTPVVRPETMRLSAGWNMFSLPGIKSRPLTDFTDDDDFRIFECAEGYVCAEIEGELDPGKSYWIYSEEGFTISYLLG